MILYAQLALLLGGVVGVWGVASCIRQCNVVGRRNAYCGAFASALCAMLLIALTGVVARDAARRHIGWRAMRRAASHGMTTPRVSPRAAVPTGLEPLSLKMAFRDTGQSDESKGARAALAQNTPFAVGASPVYLHRYTLDTFYDRSWFSSVKRRRYRASSVGEHPGWLKLKPGAGRRVRVGAAPSVVDPFPLPLGTVSVRAPQLIQGEGIWFPHARQRGGVQVDLEWAPSRVLTGAAFFAARPGHAAAYLTEVPDGVVGEALDALVAEAKQEQLAHSPHALLAALAERCRYALSVKDRHEGVHPLVGFLEYEKRGHCELFASTYALAVRKLGFPSRICLGYCGGELDTTGRILTFFFQDAHAWVEIKTDAGWTAVDPTPAAPHASGDRPRRLGRAAPLILDDLFVLPGAGGGASGEDKQSAPPQQPSTEDAGSGILWLFGLCLSLLLLAVFLLWLRTASSVSIFRHHSAEPSRLLHDLDRAFVRLGLPRRRSVTLQEQIQRLRQRGICTDAITDAQAYLYGVAFSGEPRDSERERGLRRRLKRIGIGVR
jgi:hypothetical protein